MSVYKSKKLRKDGVRWGFNIYYKDEVTGKEKRITRETYKTKREAENAERMMRNKLDNGEYNPLKGDVRLRVSDLFDSFIEYYASTGVRESTVFIVEGSLRKHFLGYFGDYYINMIKPSDLGAFFRVLATELKNYKKLNYPISQFFEYAKNDGLILTNPMDSLPKLKIVGKGKDKQVRETPIHYTQSELETVLEVMHDNLNAKQYTYFTLLAYTGLRKSEALALYKDDIDLENMRITINKTLSKDSSGNTILTDTTKGSGRKDAIPTVFPLHPRLKQPLLDYIAKTGKYNETKYFFPSHRSENGHLSMSAPDKWLVKFYNNNWDELADNGIKHRISVHGFRHSFVTALQAQNYNPNVIMYLTRHADLSTTYNYTHFNVDSIENLMELSTKKELDS